MTKKVMKTKGFPNNTKTKTNYEKTGSNLNPNVKHEMSKTSSKNIYILDLVYENIYKK
jgi:hypothetical protein